MKDEESIELLSDEEISNRRETEDTDVDEFEYSEKDLEEKKYQGTKIIRISKSRERNCNSLHFVLKMWNHC